MTLVAPFFISSYDLSWHEGLALKRRVLFFFFLSPPRTPFSPNLAVAICHPPASSPWSYDNVLLGKGKVLQVKPAEGIFLPCCLCSVTHLEASAVQSIPITWTHRQPRFANFNVIDGRNEERGVRRPSDPPVERSLELNWWSQDNFACYSSISFPISRPGQRYISITSWCHSLFF